MASPLSNSVSEPAIIEQVITEFFAKSLHIILESRSPYASSRNYSADLYTSSPSSSSSSPSCRPRDKWFNLALRDCPAALENFDLWRQSNLEPLVVDIFLAWRSLGRDEFSPSSKSEKIVERWVVQYESRKSSNIPRESHLSAKRSGSSSHLSEIPSMYKKTYKRTIVMLRSLYSTVRLLPAYKFFQDLNSSGRICTFSLSHKISSFVEPVTRAEKAEMKQFNFVPVDTPCGRLSLSVSYLPSLEGMSSEPSTPISTQFILDYVGSPTTDPLKRLHSLPSAGSLPTHISFTRRHSWSNDHGAPSVSPSPSPTYSAFPSPSPTHSACCAFNYTPSPCNRPRVHPHDHSPSTCSTSHEKNLSFDEYRPSPPYSPSSSPSPPSHLHGSHLQNSMLRAESAPVSIPLPRLGTNSGLVSQCLPPLPSPKTGEAGFSSKANLLQAQVTTASASQTSSPESKLQLKKGSGNLHAGVTLQKRQILYSGKDEIGNLFGQKLSSCSSPRILSVSSSRSFLDEFDDSEFAFPVVDEDPVDSFRAELDNVNENLVSGQLVPVRYSDAVIGSLVRMLESAAPLRPDLPNSTSQQALKEEDKDVRVEKLNTASGPMVTAYGLFKSMTAADALKELKTYKEMKESLLKQGNVQSLEVHQEKSLASEGSLEI